MEGDAEVGNIESITWEVIFPDGSYLLPGSLRVRLAARRARSGIIATIG